MQSKSSLAVLSALLIYGGPVTHQKRPNVDCFNSRAMQNVHSSKGAHELFPIPFLHYIIYATIDPHTLANILSISHDAVPFVWFGLTRSRVSFSCVTDCVRCALELPIRIRGTTQSTRRVSTLSGIELLAYSKSLVSLDSPLLCGHQ
jgi:hypothetical protein